MEKISRFLETTYGGMILMAVLILAIGIIAIKIIMYVTKRLLLNSKLDYALHAFVLMALKIILWITLIIIILSALNVPTVPLVTLLGAAGAAIALALRDSLSNVAAGLIILFSKPILKGEIIEIEEKSMLGVVDAIDLMATHLHTLDNKKVTVPNSLIINSVLLNYSREGKRRVDCVVAVSYDANLETTKQLLKDTALSCPEVIKSEEVIVGVNSLADSAVLLDVKAWCRTDDYFVVKYYLEENIKRTLDKAGIEIPYAKLDVNIKNYKI